MSKPLTASVCAHNQTQTTSPLTVLFHIHKSLCHSSKLFCQRCLTVYVCVNGVPFPLSHFMATRLFRVGCGPHVTVTQSSFSPSIRLSHPVPCPPVIPHLPLLTYVTRPHPRACGLKARIDRHCFMMTAAHGLCEEGGGSGREGEGERQRAKERPHE